MKATETKIRWLPIEDAPKDGTRILVAGIANGAAYDGDWDYVHSEWRGGKFTLCGCMTPTHFAHINPPEVKNET